MPEIKYETDFFNFSSADALESYLSRQGIQANVRYVFDGIWVKVPSGTSSEVVSAAVDAATMNYCDDCTARLRRLQSMYPEVCSRCLHKGNHYCDHEKD